jgi:ATP-dependent DNA ligase
MHDNVREQKTGAFIRLRCGRHFHSILPKRLGVSDEAGGCGVQLPESFQIPAERMLALVRNHGLEGVVAKRLSSTYEHGRRSGAWAKMRVELAQELVIGGYTPGSHGFDAVLAGFYRSDGLHFCGSVRAGFVPASRRTLHAKLTPLEAAACPFVNLPEASAGRWGQGLTAAKMKDCVWLRPETVAQFRFLEWTPADHLRHAAFVALRDDKDACLVVQEGEPVPERKPPGRIAAKAVRRRA